MNEPQVGDYVLINVDDNRYSGEFKNVLETTIGRIIDIQLNSIYDPYVIEFNNVLKYPAYDITIDRKQIRSFSKDIDQLKLELEGEKYNI